MTNIRLLSFNIHGGRSRDGLRDLGRIHDLMEKFAVDIGVFQEMETRPSHGGALADIGILAGEGRPYALPGPTLQETNGWYGNLIVSRYPILRGLRHDLQTRDLFEPRCALDALVQTPIGDLRIVGTHLSLSPWQRRLEAERLIDVIAEVERNKKNRLLLMGDINEWQRPSKLLRFLNRKLTMVSCRATFPSWLPFLRLDRVWHDAPDLHITAHRLDDRSVRRLSDHLPVLVQVTANK